ncbi:hypothetical protein BV898_19800 [Hypsibius exemplaris]|uniref:Uncharacterized protein n=1 Tax=Hypsibius exemplaris TaxID=2072580 RepID=A0A9X6RPA9_HYPEX|nr:hypothetical protein BV898_19800 [Hypsibius exemplaris]
MLKTIEEKEEVSVLEQLRRRRLECRDIVGAVDGAFEETAFFFIFANVPLIVFISYGPGGDHRCGLGPRMGGSTQKKASYLFKN